MAPTEGSVARFSTADLNPRDRLAVWRDVFCRMLFNVEMEPASSGPFRASATIRTLAGLGLMSASSTAVTYRRTAELIRSDDIMFSFGAKEGARALQRGREASAQEGDALLMLGAERAVVVRAGEGSLHCLRLPRAAIAAHVRNVEDLFCRRIPGRVPALLLLRQYLGVLDDADAMASSELRQSAATHILDLVGLALGATREAAQVAQGRGVKAARFRAIKDDIGRILCEESLSLRTIANRHQLTPRTVQRLFEVSGVTFTEYVLAQRLERARHLICDPPHGGTTLTAIAFEVGFSDLSYFNRTFRRRFGATPSDLRAAARRH
jgi:AraC-like DNA-binding protein